MDEESGTCLTKEVSLRWKINDVAEGFGIYTEPMPLFVSVCHFFRAIATLEGYKSNIGPLMT
jgi:hypothetical protein